MAKSKNKKLKVDKIKRPPRQTVATSSPASSPTATKTLTKGLSTASVGTGGGSKSPSKAGSATPSEAGS